MIPHNVALSVDETDQMSDLLAAKYIARADELTPVLVEATSVVPAARLSRYLYEQRNRPDENETLRDACVFCEGLQMEDRVTVDKRNHVVTPCWSCRPRAFCAYHAMIARHEESQEAAAGPAEGRLVGLPLPTGPGMPTDNRTTPPRRDPSPQGTPAAASCDSDDAPATLRTGFDPSKCDHGAELMGAREWSYCENCQPERCRAEQDGIERRDPWDVPPDDQIATVALPREVPAYWGRSREDWDEHDDKADILPNDRLTKYPWGGR